MDENEDRRRWVLVEKMATDMEAIRETVSLIPSMSDRLDRVESDVADIKGQMVVHSELLREHSALHREHSADLKDLKHVLGSTVEDVAQLKLASHVH